MMQPLHLVFRGMGPSDALAARIREHATKLERFGVPIISCHVAVDLPHKRHQKGKHFHVRITVHVPGHELVVDRAPEAHSAHEDAYLAVNEAFRAAQRMIRDHAQRMRRLERDAAMAEMTAG
jgi:ribosomal subunit interface protein